MSRWYERLFENYGRTYDKEGFTQGTSGECDFLEQEFGTDRSLRLLDIGCGTGRHSIEMSRRGWSVTGIDLSESMLERAREKALAAGLTPDFRWMDARHMDFREEFDAAMMLCEGSFPLMETDEMNYSILQSAAHALKPGGRFVFTTLNGLFPIFNSIEKLCSAAADGDSASYRNNSFDLMTFRDRNITTLKDDSGNSIELSCDERYYIPSEITWLLKSAGFTEIGIYGAKLGAFSRNDPLTRDDFEMLVTARKKGV